MKKESISQILSQIDENYIEEANLFAGEARPVPSRQLVRLPVKGAKRSSHLRLGTLAACLALILALSSTVFAFASEAREYKSAMQFFSENGLSTMGLSRGEIKSVYRDIKTNRFTRSETANVIQKLVTGWEIQQKEPTQEELAALWDGNHWRHAGALNGRSCRIYYVDTDGQRDTEKSVLECLQDGTSIWTIEFSDLIVEGYSLTSSGTVLWGRNESASTEEPSHGWIAWVDATGKIQWQRELKHGFKRESVASILPKEDGTWAVISRGDLKYLCLSVYDSEGNEQSFHQSEVGNLGIWNAAAVKDGYLVQLGNLLSRDTALVVKIDSEGTLVDRYCYESEDSEYYITDMAAYHGQVFLSAYAVPKQNDPGGRNEIANVLNHINGKNGQEITSAELTPIVRENYTAVLLLCDPNGGTPKTFYQMKGSLGGKLAENEDGLLTWDVESVTSAFYSPATSSFTIGGSCKVFQYCFDAEGELTSQKETGETTDFRR